MPVPRGDALIVVMLSKNGIAIDLGLITNVRGPLATLQRILV